MKKLALYAVMLTIALQTLSCSQTGENTPNSTDGVLDNAVSGMADQSNAEPSYQLPEGDFGGRNVSFYIAEDYTLLPITEETGEVLNDTIYRRNGKVEELYNVNFEYTVTPGAYGNPGWNEWLQTLESSILAGDGSIDIAGGQSYRLWSRALTNEMFQNLNDIDAFDFEQQWWPQMFMEAANLGDVLYFCQGNVDTQFWNRVYVLLFNKTLAANHNVGDLYGMVKDGTWTIDKLIEITKPMLQDIDGDGKYNENDMYGYATGKYLPIDPWNNAFMLEYVKPSDDGTLELVGLTQQITDACIKVKDFLLNTDAVFYSDTADDPLIFKEGRTLFFPTNLSTLQTLREDDIDIGILPYPKWDEQQKTYGAACAASGTSAYCVPITADGNVSGCVLEALAYYGYQDVMPVYYEKTLKGKNTRDNESEEMLDLIFDNIFFDSSMIYSFIFGDQKTPSMLMRMTVKDNKDIASAYAADENLYITTLEEINAILQGE